MRLVSDRRYISAGEYNAFKGPDSNGLRDRAYEFLVAMSPSARRPRESLSTSESSASCSTTRTRQGR
jgi:hypothetical protein